MACDVGYLNDDKNICGAAATRSSSYKDWYRRDYDDPRTEIVKDTYV